MKHRTIQPSLSSSSSTERYGKLVLSPLERGFGITIGNSLRRVLLSSIQGAAVVWVKIEGVYHEFSTIPDVVEDVTEIILNLKELEIKLNSPEGKKLYIKAKGKKEVKASDITFDGNVEILNPDLHIATLGDEGELSMEMFVKNGRGYLPAEQQEKSNLPVGVIPIDAFFCPVKKVRFDVSNTRVEQRTDYEKLVMEIWTNGSIRPDEAAARAAKILKDHLVPFINFEEEAEQIEETEKVDEEKEKLKALLSQSVEELELSIRSSNCLKAANIKTLGDLVQKTESEMLKYRNFGRKSLNEIVTLLAEKGLRFGMNVEELLKPKNGAK